MNCQEFDFVGRCDCRVTVQVASWGGDSGVRYSRFNRINFVNWRLYACNSSLPSSDVHLSVSLNRSLPCYHKVPVIHGENY